MTQSDDRCAQLLAAALAYARLGFKVLPLHSWNGNTCSCRRTKCACAAKHPRTSNGLKAATTDVNTIREWWQKWPDANVGIATGAGSGIVVIDVDPRHGGEESLAMLERANEALETVEAKTGGDGRHLVFAHPGGRVRNKVGFVPGLDARGDGGYIVVAPSQHASGGFYAWREGRSPQDLAPAPLPRWLLDIVRPVRATKRAASHVGGAQREDGQTAKALEALADEVERVRTAKKGTRNDTLNRAAFALGRFAGGGQLHGDTAGHQLLDAAIAVGLSDEEARKTIRSGWAAGLAEPRPPEPKNGSKQHATAAAAERDEYILIPGQHVTDQGECLEIGNDDFARLVLSRLPDGALYRWDRIAGEITGSPGARKFVEITPDRMRLLIDEHVRLAKWVKKRNSDEHDRIFVACSRDQANLVVAAAEYSIRVRVLRLITRYPVFAGDYDLVTSGWNDASGVFYDEPPTLAGLAPQPQTQDEIAAFFDDLFIDFPFKDVASKHNFLGLLLTPLLVPAIDGCIPMHLVMAPLERTGKGLLISTFLGTGVCGSPVPALQMGSAEEEREKRITSLILEGATVVHFDNVPTRAVLDSAALCSLLTSRVWKGRELGKSRAPALPNNLITVASGNNVRATGEAAKRCVPIWLQPADDHPEDRDDFVHDDIQEYVRKRRRELLAVLIDAVKQWKAAGQPRGGARLGGFEEWACTIGGILAFAGFDAWMTNYRAWVSVADEWAADAERLAELWWARYGSAAITATQALELLSSTTLFPWVSARLASGQLMSFTKTVLLPMLDRPLKGYRLEKDASGNNSLYRLMFDPEAACVAHHAGAGGPGGRREVET